MYGYDIRGEVFGSGGMARYDVRRSSMTLFDKDDTRGVDTDHFAQGYRPACLLSTLYEKARLETQSTGIDARNALAIALGATGVRLEETTCPHRLMLTTAGSTHPPAVRSNSRSRFGDRNRMREEAE